jgi:hypothetical protein
MDFIILKGREETEREFDWEKRIHNSWTKYISKGKSCSHFPLFCIENGVEACVSISKCMFEILEEDVYICPTHYTLHHCKKNNDKQCFISWNGRQYFCRVSLRDLQQDEFIALDFTDFTSDVHINKGPIIYTSYIRCASSVSNQRTNTDEKYELMMRNLKHNISKVVAVLCSPENREEFKKLILKKKNVNVHMGENKKDIAAEIMICRDIYNFATKLLMHIKRKTDRQFILRHQTSFVYVLLLRYSKGLQCDKYYVLKTPPYCKAIIPIPKRTHLESLFNVNVPKMSKCIKIVQQSLESIRMKQKRTVLL